MTYVFTLIRFTKAYFAACTGLGVVLFCVLPATLGLAAEAFFDAFTSGGGISVWTAIAVLAGLQLGQVVTEIGVAHTWSGFSYETHTLLQRNLLSGILRNFRLHGLAVPPGDAISRFRDEPPSITSGSMDGVCDLVGRGVFALVAVVVMGSIDPSLTVAAFAPVIASALLSDPLGSRSARYGAAARVSTAELTGFLGEVFAGHLAIRVAGAAPQVVHRLAEIAETRRRMSVRDRVFAEAVNSMNHHLVHVATGAVLLLGAGKIRSGSFTVGELALFVVYLDQLTYLPAEIGRVITETKRTHVSIARMHSLMPGDPPERVVEHAPIHLRRAPDVTAMPQREHLDRLDVEELTYRHPTTGRGIEGVSFGAERGTLTVITGRIGSGKTTLLHALLGLCPLDGGRVLWNGGPVEDPAAFFVPPRAAFTPQVPHLFSETLLDNLVLGRAASTREVDAALHAAALEEDVASFDHGLQTMVGPRGLRLSGGQIQRAAAARMFLRSPELLVLDDVSSALDAATEATLWVRLLERRDEATCVAVSHSPIALARADQVVVLDAGRVVSG